MKKVKVIRCVDPEEGYALEKGNEYIVVEEHEEHYCIVNDIETFNSYPKSWFVEIKYKESWSYDEVCGLLHMLYNDTNTNINWHENNPIDGWIDDHVQTEI